MRRGAPLGGTRVKSLSRCCVDVIAERTESRFTRLLMLDAVPYSSASILAARLIWSLGGRMSEIIEVPLLRGGTGGGRAAETGGAGHGGGRRQRRRTPARPERQEEAAAPLRPCHEHMCRRQGPALPLATLHCGPACARAPPKCDARRTRAQRTPRHARAWRAEEELGRQAAQLVALRAARASRTHSIRRNGRGGADAGAGGSGQDAQLRARACGRFERASSATYPRAAARLFTSFLIFQISMLLSSPSLIAQAPPRGRGRTSG